MHHRLQGESCGKDQKARDQIIKAGPVYLAGLQAFSDGDRLEQQGCDGQGAVGNFQNKPLI